MSDHPCTHCHNHPASDDTFLCKPCIKTLDVALANIGAGTRQLTEARTRLQGRRYDLPHGKGGTKNLPVGMDLRFDLVTRDETGRVTSGHGTALEDDAKSTLTGWVRICHDTWQGISWPADTTPAMCGWLAERRNALAGQDWSRELIRDALALERRFKRLLEVGPEPIFAGLCLVCGVFGDRVPLYGHRGDTELECRECGHVVDAEKRWDTMMADLDARLCTAAEIARLATYFGLLGDRDWARRLINVWHSKGVLTPFSTDAEGRPLFRFGEVSQALITVDATRRSGASRAG